jgi:hypothetical protein
VDNKLTLEQLDVGIAAAIANAESLIQEAAVLLQHGFHARAYTLAQFTFLDAKEMLSANAKLTKRSPETAKKIFASIGNPDEIDPKVGLELLKEVTKLLNEKRAQKNNLPK